MGQRSISSSFVINIVEDGTNPSYVKIQEAWSNQTTSPSQSTMPTDCTESSWSDTTPTKTKTYLWRRSCDMTYNESTGQYVAGQWTYIRLSGDNGTSINIKGHEATVEDLPPTGQDGDAYVVDDTGDLYMWSAESGRWVDIGQFQGDNGKTFYQHIAWASDTDDTGTIPPKPETQTTTPNKSSVTGFSTSPFDGAAWMGILVDETVADSQVGNLYTWNEVQGAPAIHLDLENENDTMLYTSGGVLVSGNVVATARLYDGDTAVPATSVTWKIGANDCTATNSRNVITVTGMSADDAYVRIRATYRGTHYYARLTLHKLIEEDKYDVEANVNSIAYNKTTDDPQTTTISATCYKTSINQARVASVPPTGYYFGLAGIRHNGTIVTIQSTQTSTLSYSVDNSEYTDYILYIGNANTFANCTLFKDRETIPVVWAENGADGDNAIRVDLDNENDTMLYTDTNTHIGSNPVTHATLYDGGEPITTGVTWDVSASDNVSYQQSGNTFTILGMTASTGSLTIRATYQGNTYTSIFSLKKLINKDKYWIVFEPSAISYNTTTLQPATSVVSGVIYKLSVDGTQTTVTSLPSGWSLKWYGDNSTQGQNISFSTGRWGFMFTTSSYNRIKIELTDTAGILDSETILIAKVTNGAKGDPGTPGEEGAQGKMGRNIYYAGKMSEVAGQSFVVDDHNAPYVNISNDDSAPNCKVFVGNNGTYTFPSNTSGYNTDNWASMETNFKYLITKAMFSDFANLGSAIFNEDFMFSQYGSLTAYGNNSIMQSRDYSLINPARMDGAITSPIHESSAVITISNTGWNAEYNRFSFTVAENKKYYLLVQAEKAGSTNPIEFRVAPSVDYWDAYTQSITDTNLHYYVLDGMQFGSGTCYFYYRRTGTSQTDPKLRYTMVSECGFRPNIYADWLKGFFYSQYGKFKNVIIEGVFNNLITEIDYVNGINSDLFIKYDLSGQSNWKRYCLDILRCGNIVRIKSIPDMSDVDGDSTDKFLWLPFFVTSGNYSRTYTKLAKDGTILTTPREIDADEMRMLVGRKLLVIFDVSNEQTELNYRKLTTHYYTPTEMNNLSTVVKELANGQNVVNTSVASNLERRDVAMTPSSVYLECKMLRDTYNGVYCYVWTQNVEYSSIADQNGIDETWTNANN